MKKKQKTAAQAPAFQIGASEGAIRAAEKSVIAILNAPHADEKTKVAALKALSAVCSVNYATISHCSAVMGPPQSADA